MKENQGDSAELIRRAKALEREALEEIFRLHYEKIYRYSYFKLGSVEDAEDVAATVFLEMVQRLADFEVREGASLASWLFRIAHNLVVNKIRGRVREERGIHRLVSEGPLPEDDCEKVLEAMGAEEILGAMDSLTEAQRTVIALRFANEMSIKEVCAAIGKPETAVKALQRRALLTLKRRMRSSVAEAPLTELAEAGETP